EPSLRALRELDYPNYEVIVINDGSPDRTSEVVRQWTGRGTIRLLDKRTNEGKALALNDALPLCRGEILLILDADVIVEPGILRPLWKQRRLWARGLAQVLRRHYHVPFRWKLRRLWPVWYESVASILWAYTMVGITLYWVVSRASGYVPYGASPIPNFWGMTIATACMVQLFVGALMDAPYDKGVLRSL